MLPGDDEARLTFLAVRRWFGWSTGRLAVFDIGGGSLEIAVGADEAPDVAQSLPLGAGRLTREWLADDVDEAAVTRAPAARSAQTSPATPGRCCGAAPADHAVATSKTFRSLARICGAPAVDGRAAGTAGRSTSEVLAEMIPRLVAMSTRRARPSCPGSRSSRAHQVVAGALVADAVMDIFDLPELEICPWALREGIILERLDQIGVVPVVRALLGSLDP